MVGFAGFAHRTVSLQEATSVLQPHPISSDLVEMAQASSIYTTTALLAVSKSLFVYVYNVCWLPIDGHLIAGGFCVSVL